jgi:hypothetical protein
MARSRAGSKFQNVLDSIESMSPEEQDQLMEVLYKRSIEARRARLAKDIAEARAAYRKGNVSRGSAADIMRELSA